jgi:hypothetical protein
MVENINNNLPQKHYFLETNLNFATCKQHFRSKEDLISNWSRTGKYSELKIVSKFKRSVSGEEELAN